MSEIEDLRKEQIKDKISKIVYPHIIKWKGKKLKKAYLFSKALLHLRRHFTPHELATIFHRSKNFIYKKLKDLRENDPPK